ncbi:MAG TPA: hypothetical protein PLI09_22660 [Candidatus Hydrogenedentes bacterium]|nr:hypothetical protein [Candidatus Hydrogenedentota bacterium]
MRTRRYMSWRMCVMVSLCLAMGISDPAFAGTGAAHWKGEVPPSWEMLPLPRYVDYGLNRSFITMTHAAVVRREGGSYQTVRHESGELVGASTVIEEELIQFLKESGVQHVAGVTDTLGDYSGYDTLILLGNPSHNAKTQQIFDELGLSFGKWDDPTTPEHDFTDWKDFGKEGYFLKVGKHGGQNIVILAGYDYDSKREQFCGAGTFYAFQSFKQLLIKEGGKVRIKTAEVADKPLMDVRGAFTGFPPSEEEAIQNIHCLPQLKINQNIFWYGNQVVGYNAQSASKFRYPWTPEQLVFCQKVGQYCHEHFITQVFAMNPDHYNSEWAAAKTLDGKQKDPLHYDLNHTVEPGVKEMWGKLGYEVKNDVDVLAAKYSQLNEVCPTAAFAMFNEDDIFGLVHEEDKKLYGITGDPVQDAVHYGQARGTVLAALYKKIRQMRPDSPEIMPVCPPDGVPYQVALEKNENSCRDFMFAFTSTLKEQGVLDYMPVLTTGGGTAAEILTNKNVDDFKSWCCSGTSVLICDNNFPCHQVGAYTTDVNAPRGYLQQSAEYPAGYRDKDLYKRVWGVWWNGIAMENGDLLGWKESQFLWHILALDKAQLDAAATRKIADAELYPMAKSLFDEYDAGACYMADEMRPDPPFAVSNHLRFVCHGWVYAIDYPDAMRLEAQRLRDKLARLLPPLAAKWAPERLRWLGYDTYGFCSVYLARGYIRGWNNSSGEDLLKDDELRDLYLEADDLQQRFFAGPLDAPGKMPVVRVWAAFTVGRLVKLITGERLKYPVAESIAEVKEPYVDIWASGLQGKFYEPVSSISLDSLPDGERGWGKVEEAGKEKFRMVTGEAALALDVSTKGRMLIRVKMGTAGMDYAASIPVSLSAGKESLTDAVCRPRWVTWRLFAKNASKLTIKTEKPVPVYAVEIYKEI